jgi:LasA protease
MVRQTGPRQRGMRGQIFWAGVAGLVAGIVGLAACSGPAAPAPVEVTTPAALTPSPEGVMSASGRPTPLPTRTLFGPATLFTYTVQTGDTVAALAAHFNTTPQEIAAANPGVPLSATLSSGLTLTVPTYYFALGGPTFKIIPDSEFVNGPANKDFDPGPYIQAQPGYLSQQSAYVAQHQRNAADTIKYVSSMYSINPKLLLALMEWRSGALSQADASPDVIANPYNRPDDASGFYLQSDWAANELSIGYYAWRSGALTALTLRDGYRVREDMYQNAATVGVHYLLAQLLTYDEFEKAVGPDGFAATYYALWGNPFAGGPPPDVIPGNLTQPPLALPFSPKQAWSLTGGPHPGWGEDPLLPWAAMDLAPEGVQKCSQTDLWVTASAAGLIVRSGDNAVLLDLDGDGYEQTGWVVFYFHMSERDRIAAGTHVNIGDPLGHPSCEGGIATGTHVHMARKYNGEWIPGGGIVPGVVPFDLGGWTAEAGAAPYLGRLMRIGAWAQASTTTTDQNRIYWAP